jgi:hypothetical protein
MSELRATNANVIEQQARSETAAGLVMKIDEPIVVNPIINHNI